MYEQPENDVAEESEEEQQPQPQPDDEEDDADVSNVPSKAEGAADVEPESALSESLNLNPIGSLVRNLGGALQAAMSVKGPHRPSAIVGGRRRAGELAAVERRNWLIHLHYVRNELDETQALIKEQLTESAEQCEYAMYISGLILRKQGHVDDSLDVFQKCAEQSPRNGQYIKQIGRSLFLVGKHDAAVDVLQQAAELDDTDWEVHYWMAMCYRQMNNIDETKSCLMRALELNKHERALRLLGDVCQDSGDRLLAIECYKKCIELTPDDADTHTKLGLLYLHTASFQHAFEALGRALSVDSSHSGAILAAGSMMQKYADYDVAVSKYRLAATITPDSAQLWSNIGMCFYGKAKYVAAVSCLKRANYLSPLDWQIQYNLGLVHLALGQHASAFHFVSAAINLQPNSALAFGTLAVILTHLGDYANAAQAYDRAFALDSNDPAVPLNAAIFNIKQGQADGARQWLLKYEQMLNNNSVKLDSDVKQTADGVYAAVDRLQQRSATAGGGGAGQADGSGRSKTGDTDQGRQAPGTAQTQFTTIPTADGSLGRRESVGEWSAAGGGAADNASLKTMASRNLVAAGTVEEETTDV